MDNVTEIWLALCAGNTHQHWALFHGDHLQYTWEIPQSALSPTTDLPTHLAQLHQHAAWPTDLDLHHPPHPLWLCSVVPAQSHLWQGYPSLQYLQLAQIPLSHTYPTLGLDRALAVWGAGQRYGFPVLVVDGGTGLTLTAAHVSETGPAQFGGGAILPGIGLQLRSLSTQTAALPNLDWRASWGNGPLPPRWAHETGSAICSGVLYTLLAGLRDFLEDWWQQHPGATVVFTGGDGAWLWATLLHRYSELNPRWLKLEPQLLFWAIQSLRNQL